MEWWQIILILLGSGAVGIGGGILFSRLINRFLKDRFTWKRAEKPATDVTRFEATPAVEGQRPTATSATEEQGSKGKINMVPLLSRRSIIVLAIGLLVGVGLGLGYWAISPVGGIQMGWPPIEIGGNEEPTLHESTVQIQVVTRGSSYTPVQELRRHAAYYASRMNTVPFFEFLGQKIAEQAPQYSRTAEELDRMTNIDVRYEEVVAYIRVKVTSQIPEEAFLIASTTAEALQDYLYTEESDIQLEEYQNRVAELQSVRTALLEAEKELAAIQQQESNYDLNVDPDYVALIAKIEALELELTTRAGELAILIADDETGRDFEKTQQALERTSTALADARKELASLETEASISSLELRLAYTDTKAKVDKLVMQLNNLTAELASWDADNSGEPQEIIFRAVGPPSIPLAIPTEKIRGRNAVMMGALFGVGGAWLLLNRKWLVNGMPTSPHTPVPEEDEEEE